MNKVIIVEGAQGVGKTSVTRLLREKMTYTVLISLTGTPDKTPSGEKKVYIEHYSVLQMIDQCKHSDLNFVLDRSFITEKVYCKLNYTEYDFSSSNALMEYLNHLGEDYDVYYVTLVANANTLEQRLHRDKPQHANVIFNHMTSLNQQNEYLNIAKHIMDEYPSIKVRCIDSVSKTPEQIAQEIINMK